MFSPVSFASALAAFALIGAIDAAYGPLLSIVSGRFGVTLPTAGALISIHFCGALAGVGLLLAARRRVSGRLLAISCLGVLGAGCLVIASARAWPALAAGAFTVGLGFGMADFGLNDLAARTEPRHRASRLTALNATFGAGAIAGPAVVTALRGATLTAGFAFAAAIACAAAIGMRGLHAPAWPASGASQEQERGRTGGGRTERGGRERRPAGPAAARAARGPSIAALFGLAYLCYVACESGVAGWTAADLAGLGYSPHLAGATTSAFWGALTAGRLCLIPVSRLVAPRRIVLAAAPALLGCVALAAIPSVAPAAFAAAGLAAAPIFPVGLAWAASAAPSGRRATSWALTCSMIGGVLGPGAIAGVVSATAVRAVPFVLAVFAAGAWATLVAVPARRPVPRDAPRGADGGLV